MSNSFHPACSALLAVCLAMVAAGEAAAQSGKSGSDRGDARRDALLGTANAATPVPQSNRFATTPGLEQQAPGPLGHPTAGRPVPAPGEGR